MLIFETQKYKASVVAAACVLAARHIGNKRPLWNEKYQKITSFTFNDLLKCANSILSNFNILKIGSASTRVIQVFGPQPFEFDGILIEAQIEDIQINVSANTIDLPEQETTMYSQVSPRQKMPPKSRKYTEGEKSSRQRDNTSTSLGSYRPLLYASNQTVCATKPIGARKKSKKGLMKDVSIHTLRMSSQDKRPHHLSMMQRASNSFKKGLNNFIENTGNILKQVKNDMAQEDFSLSHAFTK